MNNLVKTFEDKVRQLPKYQLTQTTKDEMHRNLMEALNDDEVKPMRGRIDIRKITVGIASAAALTLFSILCINLVLTDNQLTGDVEPSEIIQDPSPIGQLDASDQDLREEQILIEQKAKEILQVLHNRDMEQLASFVHKDKGLLFAPEAYIADYSMIFPQSQVARLLEDQTEYVWGLQEANSEIKLTPENYFNERIQPERFLDSDEVNLDPNVPSGERSTNIKDYFPESKVVEFHYAGTEQYEGMDWRSLHLVFEKNEQAVWDLVAIVNGLWAP
ncbi:hypothetical protein [Bacillus alkalicellulosilyticus]|uniref:hypothetical protein n=1 Tax=Alkalihalobacterium alkalicellulosilyticum TaxID=1912214 RepID=UPI000997FFB4|nr:hypothetical protein [Bacillus alkalicellulosilyticus]